MYLGGYACKNFHVCSRLVDFWPSQGASKMSLPPHPPPHPTGLERDFYLKVAFPVLTSYLTKHSGYFMPACGAERMHSFGSREEKAVILQ